MRLGSGARIAALQVQIAAQAPQLGQVAPFALGACMGQPAFDVLESHCEARVATLTAARSVASKMRTPEARLGALAPFAPHPADPQ